MSLVPSNQPNGSFNADGFQIIWDATCISLAQSCPRKYQLAQLENWRSKSKSVHLWFGGHIASALENFYKKIIAGGERETVIREIVHQLLIDTWDEETNSPQTFLEPTKTRETLVRTFVWYVDHYEEDPMSIWVTPSGEAAVEHSFILPMTADISYAGHLDRIVEYNNGRYGMDQKTTKTTINQNYMSQFSPNNQFSGYTWAGQIVYDTELKGMVIDAMQIAVGFTRFHRGFTYRHQAQLDEWFRDTVETVKSIWRMTEQQYFPMNPTSCGDFGGCQFRDVCSRHPSNRKQFLKADYDQSMQWDPSVSR